MTDCKIHIPIAIRHISLPPLPNTNISNIYKNFLQTSIINQILFNKLNNNLNSNLNYDNFRIKVNIDSNFIQSTNLKNECKHGANCKIYSKSHRQKFVHPPVVCPYGDRCKYYKNNECIFVHNKS
jgi:hypothetical protein